MNQYQFQYRDEEVQLLAKLAGGLASSFVGHRYAGWTGALLGFIVSALITHMVLDIARTEGY